MDAINLNEKYAEFKSHDDSYMKKYRSISHSNDPNPSWESQLLYIFTL